MSFKIFLDASVFCAYNNNNFNYLDNASRVPFALDL